MASPLPLESLDLAVLPKATHNIAWSPDNELAVACDDCILLYVPDFKLTGPATTSMNQPFDGPRQYDESALRFPVAPLKDPELNRHLFENVGQEFSGYSIFTGAGSGILSGHGSTMNHTVSLAWSPCGLGRVGRSVLAVHSAAGIVTIYCQGTPAALGSTARSMRPWISAWHVGGGFLVPAAKGHIPCDRKEYILAFSWSRDTQGNGAFMSYMNDDHEVVILFVKTSHDANAPTGHPGTWTVLEVARFDAHGPHPADNDPTDPDYSYHTSSFALSWSPWLRQGDSMTSIISYVAHNYIGFRQITVNNLSMSEAHKEPCVEIGRADATGVCLYLSTDAFVVWEDQIWEKEDSHICRGVIASPMKVQAFDLPFEQKAPVAKHDTDLCDTTYPPEEDVVHQSNPITGLVIHPPSFSQNRSTPSYTLVRLSATHDNPTWHQTNLILPPPLDDHADTNLRWATEIRQILEHQLPRTLAYGRSHGNQEDNDDAFFSDEDEEGDGDDDDSLEDSDEEFEYEDEVKNNIFGIGAFDPEDQVHLNRVRIWGLTVSPGGGTSAVFISQHSSIEYEKDTFAGIKCRVLFGRNVRAANAIMETDTSTLSTEAKAWEWMYGGGPPVPGYSTPAQPADTALATLRENLEATTRDLTCVFCLTPIVPISHSASRCSNGHVFERCANTGVPILAPSVSRTCDVCGMKCLKITELVKLAPHLQESIMASISADLCGGCGGKFTV